MIDTHCHIHQASYPLNADDVIASARQAGVTKLVCVGTDANDSAVAVEFVSSRENCWASIGLHPHDATLGAESYKQLKNLAGKSKVVAIGECGLDYFYNHSPKRDQEAALRFQIELALEHNLPMIFHVRDAFNDFWPILDSYPPVRGVIHSFTAYPDVLEQALARNLLVGFNGIMTFTKDDQQIESLRRAPLESIVLETDAPFLTPTPLRGSINEPRYIDLVARFLADTRHEALSDVVRQTDMNATRLFGI